MNKLLVCIKDELRGFGSVQTVESEQVAYRDFAFAVNSQEIMKQNFKDYGLWCVGSYDTETGVITNNLPRLIVDASSVLRHKKESEV